MTVPFSRLGQSNGMDPDTGLRIPQTPQQVPFPERTKTLQGPESVHPGQGTGTLPQEPAQERRPDRSSRSRISRCAVARHPHEWR